MFMSTAFDWAKSIREEGVITFPGGEGKVAAVDPWDIAAVAAVALTESGHEGQAYALTGPEALSFGEMAQVLTAVLGKQVRYLALVRCRAQLLCAVFATVGSKPWQADQRKRRHPHRVSPSNDAIHL